MLFVSLLYLFFIFSFPFKLSQNIVFFIVFFVYCLPNLLLVLLFIQTYLFLLNLLPFLILFHLLSPSLFFYFLELVLLLQPFYILFLFRHKFLLFLILDMIMKGRDIMGFILIVVFLIFLIHLSHPFLLLLNLIEPVFFLFFSFHPVIDFCCFPNIFMKQVCVFSILFFSKLLFFFHFLLLPLFIQLLYFILCGLIFYFNLLSLYLCLHLIHYFLFFQLIFYFPYDWFIVTIMGSTFDVRRRSYNPLPFLNQQLNFFPSPDFIMLQFQIQTPFIVHTIFV